MPHRILGDETTYDAAFEAWAGDLTALFRECWDVTLSFLVENPEEIRSDAREVVTLESDSVELLLFEFLGELLYRKDAEERVYRLGQLELDGGSAPAPDSTPVTDGVGPGQDGRVDAEESSAGVGEPGVRAGRGASYRLEAEIVGETLDPERHCYGVDVKAVTLYAFTVELRDDGWFARVVLDT